MLAGQATNSTRSRIENDVEIVKEMIERVSSITERHIRHARTLGYFELPKDAAASTPTPVITTLADALQALDREINHCSGSLNVFD